MERAVTEVGADRSFQLGLRYFLKASGKPDLEREAMLSASMLFMMRRTERVDHEDASASGKFNRAKEP